MADTAALSKQSGGKSAEAFRTISEVATALEVPSSRLLEEGVGEAES